MKENLSPKSNSYLKCEKLEITSNLNYLEIQNQMSRKKNLDKQPNEHVNEI